MDKIRISFQNLKKDIEDIKEKINSLKNNLNRNNEQLLEFTDILINILEKKENLIKINIPTQKRENSTYSTHISTNKIDFSPLKHQNLDISIGNEGVQTDRQTNQQTDKKSFISQNNLNKVANIFDSLDSLKKELRLKFKKLTDQEMLIFSKIYQLEEQLEFVDYKILAQKLNLTESSIRDYISRLIKKDIPVEKIKINNKNIQLKISKDLRKVVSLSTLLQLREL